LEFNLQVVVGFKPVLMAFFADSGAEAGWKWLGTTVEAP
jgi:hypothetical protein